ncbi:hypothetical protein HF1_10670 [Mycoplasma haemofelis str. Langford 1]|uniref:Uncharacterized protein n=1 Tax=Mycoplasma haemofelis (strain Langford 1) TaxID=941640 RepID=E8ZIV4_MYCHL|nr:hypothetical protein [Mycoplasma haemofelis]CBY93075.1 hypothetical protein HF1_10670 [Mycoplasma haemofelis str. Langford 1]
MAHFLAKLAAVGGGTAAAGGGIVAGASSVFGSQGEPSEKPKVKNHVEETPPVAPTPKESAPESSCIVWEAEDPKGTPNNRSFKKLLEKYKSKDDFFQKWGDGSDRPMQNGFKDEIEKACKGTNDKKNVDGRVYVWWMSSSNKWIYAGDMHDGNHKWEEEISDKPSA